MSQEFDYVIIGAGSAGCAVASRLSEDPNCRVLVLEAGGSDKPWDLRVEMPAAMALPLRSHDLCWHFSTEPQPALGGRRIAWPRGRVVGGSSATNGLVFVRGHPRDFDEWASASPAFAHWRYAAVLPYFRRLETFSGGASAYRGGDGPVTVRRGSEEHELHEAFIAAGIEAGHPFTPDVNGAQQEGVAYFDMTVKDGRRESAASAYLRPIRERPNLRVLSGARVARLLFSDKRCVGVAFEHRGRQRTMRARQEVVLAAGAIGSPQILMLSGVGPRRELAAANVDVVHHLPGVGRDLQDHLEVFVQQRCTRPVTLASIRRWPVRARIGLRWMASRSGWGATNHLETGAFLRSRAGLDRPDVQLHFLPRVVTSPTEDEGDVHGYQIHVSTLGSPARGRMILRSDRFDEAPLIDPQYMTDDRDWADFRAGIRLAREILAQRPLADYGGGELQPGSDRVDDATLDAFVRDTAQTAYHPCGTCRMGDDDTAVVDDTLAVHGLEGLRVADSSIFPRIVNGNTGAAALMVGEKAADLIRHGRPAPPRERRRRPPERVDSE